MKAVNCFLYPFFKLTNLFLSNFSETELFLGICNGEIGLFSRRMEIATPNLPPLLNTSDELLLTEAASGYFLTCL